MTISNAGSGRLGHEMAAAPGRKETETPMKTINNHLFRNGKARGFALLAVVLVLMARSVFAATNELTSLLQRGLFEEEANRNLTAAISNYESLAAKFDQNKDIAATAIFRLGECYRKLGRTNDAAMQYQRIVRDFADQQTLVTLSRQNLAGLGQPSVPSSTEGEVNETRRAIAVAEAEAASLEAQLNQLKRLPADQLRIAVQQNFSNPVITKLFQDLADTQRKRIELELNYTAESPQMKNAEAQMNTIYEQIDTQINGVLLGLQTKLNIATETAKNLRAQGGQVDLPAAKDDNAVVTDEEEKEIRRIQAMIQNSPDLVNAPSPQGTPLFQAASKGQLRVAAYLLDHGAEVDAPSGTTGNFYNWTPLLGAANNGHKRITVTKRWLSCY
jgi:hypothetical protein